MEFYAGFWIAAEDGDDVGVCADGDTFGFQVGGPVGVEGFEAREGDHEREVGKKGLGIVVPKLHVRIVKEAFEDCAGYVGCLIT